MFAFVKRRWWGFQEHQLMKRKGLLLQQDQSNPVVQSEIQKIDAELQFLNIKQIDLGMGVVRDKTGKILSSKI